MKPEITYEEKLKKPQVVKAAGTLIISVQINGQPKPNVTWMIGDVELSPSDDLSIDRTDAGSTLTIKKITYQYSGCVSVKASNEAGADTASFDVNVKGILNVSKH